ncbi:hypothetical protein N7508_008497 [Penicillium antarcticum]|uniref:uncharacterized protein n=1 Tax=Penicillium antarcticum TaxID=416450 RepID=UPI00239A63C3|nr:uncharacterized protein N7508_008497 [Penicillium antarcticum]KAJ5293676.1 hypothetical protein N7508_008497 [Penicillium antarcticum]
MKTRLERVESLLSESAVNAPNDRLENHSSPAKREKGLSLLIADRSGSSTFIGPASGFSLFSPSGLQWISSQIGSTELADFILNRSRIYMLSWSEEMISMWRHLTPELQAPLPPKASADIAIDYFFEFVNSTMPLFDKEEFMKLFEQQYSLDPPVGLPWYASLNVVLAIGGLICEDERGQCTPSVHTNRTIEGEGHVLNYLRNCYGYFTQLAFSCKEILAVQALTGMAFLLEMLLDVEASYMALGAAARLSIALGLHRKTDDPHLSVREIDERRNVFWVLYVFDKMMSLRLGRPPAIGDKEIEIDEPRACEPLSHPDTPDPSLYFENFVKLSKIESEIYNALYSAHCPSSNSWTERVATVDRLNKKVIDWRVSLPDGIIQPGQPLNCSVRLVPSAVLLHSEYYNCLSTLHRLSSYRGTIIASDKSDHKVSPDDSAVSSSRTACIGAARDTARIMGSLNLNDRSGKFRNNLIRRVSYYPLSAFLMIFSNILLHPHDSGNLDDLDLLHTIVDSLSPALTISTSSLAVLLLEIFQKMMDISESLVHQTQPIKNNHETREDVTTGLTNTENGGFKMDLSHKPITTPSLESFSQAGHLPLASDTDPWTDPPHAPQVLHGENKASYSTSSPPSEHHISHSVVFNHVSFPDDMAMTLTLDWELANLRATGVNDYSLHDSTGLGIGF